MADEGFTFGSFSSLTGVGSSAGIPPWTLPKPRLGRVDFSVHNAPAAFTPVAGLTLKVSDPVTGHIPLFSVNDLLRMKAFNGAAVLDNWLRVDSVTDPGSGLGYFQYGCTLMSGTPGTFPKGTAIVNYGQAGQGFVLLTSDMDFSPYIDVATHAGAPWASVTPRVRLGNLDGVLGLSQQWGIALGFDLTDVTSAARYVVASDQQVALHNVDLALYNGASQSVELTNAGRLKIGTNIAAAATTQLYYNPAAATYNGEALGAGTLLLGDNTSGRPNLKINDTDIQFRRGTTTHLLIDGTNIVVGEVGAGKSNILITAGEIDLRTNTTVKISLDTSGNINLTGELIVGTAGDIRSGATAVLTGNGYWLDYNGGTPRFRIGTITGGALDEGIYWDGSNIQIYSGTGSFGSPTTGLKIYTNATIGLIEMWGGGTKQVFMGTDGKLYAGGGNLFLDENGASILTTTSYQNNRAYHFERADGTVLGGVYSYDLGAGSTHYGAALRSLSVSGEHSVVEIFADSPSGKLSTIALKSNEASVQQSGLFIEKTHLYTSGAMRISTSSAAAPVGMLDVDGSLNVTAGLNVGSATGAGTGEIRASNRIKVDSRTDMSLRMNKITALANNGVAGLLNTDGVGSYAMVFVGDGSGRWAIFSTTGGGHTTVEMSDPSAVFSITAGTASSTNIYWSAGNARYEVENKTGGVQTYLVFYFVNE